MRRTRLILILPLILEIIMPAAPAASLAPVQLGAYYFDGWSGQTDAHHLKERLRTEFSAREPIWGWHSDTPALMREQIDLAADAGLSFWSFCWYWPETTHKETPLHHALSLYLAAPNRERLKFCLMVANHAGYEISPKDWPDVTAAWLKLMREPGYVTVDGKPLLIFFSPQGLIHRFGSAAAVRQAFENLRQQARAAGLPGVSIAACCLPGPRHGWPDLKVVADAGFDLTTAYNYPALEAHGPEKRQPFADLAAAHLRIWNEFAQRSPLPYIPVVTAGWDMRAWEAPALPQEKMSYYYPDRTPDAMREFIVKALNWVSLHPNKTPREKMVMIYAWNEYGEGSYLTPTRAEGDAYLQAVRHALSASAAQPSAKIPSP